LQQKGKIAKWLDKHNAGTNARNKIRKLHDDHTTFLFGKFDAGLKVKAAVLELHHLQKIHPNKDINELAAMSARIINDDFGGEHLERMGRNKTKQHFMRLMLLAPDWTESNVRTMVRVFTAGSKEERHLYRIFWGRAMSRIVFASVAVNMALALFDGGDDEDYWETVMRRYKDAFEDPERLNWLAADVTPIWRAMKGDDYDPNERRYFSIAGHFKDPYKWVVQAIDGSWTTPLKNKGSIFMNTFFSLTSGTNWQGKVPTTTSELLGTDDKGVYSTSRLNPDWKRGDPIEDKYLWKVGEPKGGKHAGELLKWAAPGERGGVKTKSMPSFIMGKIRDWMPIPLQNATALAMGEIDAFDALSHGVGMHMGRNFMDRDELADQFKKIVKTSTIYIRETNQANKDRDTEKYNAMRSSIEYRKARLIKSKEGTIDDLQERYDDALDRADDLQAEKLKLEMEVKMQQIIDQYNKIKLLP
ncbi:hypothetical protein DRQ25_15270, partial [Candidatus Fermentibacteria bacterium]